MSARATSGGAGPDKPDHVPSWGSSSRPIRASCRPSSSASPAWSATSIWQYRQSLTAAEAARSEQAIARTKADNDWRIARAEILAKNLTVLSTQGPQTADQRFGVLLSLTRGAILDPELAVSYALELGKDNAAYMRAVLEATAQKNYDQLAQAFKMTCMQRFGVEKAADICKDDALADRSDAIAQVFQNELRGRAAATPSQPRRRSGPLSILKDERQVQSSPGKLAWLFEPYLQDLYERRQWHDIQRFESFSTGARLVAALVLATARTGELVSASEKAELDKFHADRRKWLVGYLLGRTCDADCRGKLVDVMLSSYGEAEGDYDEPLRRLLKQPHAEAAPTFGHLHARLLWCQIDADDRASFRDKVLVPALAEALAAAEARRAADRRSRRSGRAGPRAGRDRRRGAGRVEEGAGRRCRAPATARSGRWPASAPAPRASAPTRRP